MGSGYAPAMSSLWISHIEDPTIVILSIEVQGASWLAADNLNWYFWEVVMWHHGMLPVYGDIQTPASVIWGI